MPQKTTQTQTGSGSGQQVRWETLQVAEPPARKKPPKKGPSSVLVTFLLLATTLITIVGLSGTRQTYAPITEAPIEAPAVIQPVEVSQPKVEQAAPQEIEQFIEPTLDGSLFANPDVSQIDVAAATLKFNKVIVEHVQPADIGLANCTTDSAVFNAICELKDSYANTGSFDEMADVMQRTGDYVKISAQNGDEVAKALREVTFMEFQRDAINAIGNIGNLNEEQFPQAVSNIGYYAVGMQVLATTDTEKEIRKNLVENASAAFAERLGQLQSERNAAQQQQTNNVQAPEQAQEQAPKNSTNPNDQVAPANNQQPEPAPLEKLLPEAKVENTGTNVQTITVTAPKVSDYSEYPQHLAEPLKGFSGLSLNPEGVVLALQQFKALLTTGSAGGVSEWIVWSTYHTPSPLGEVWLFSLINSETLKSTWPQFPELCREYLTQLMEDPRRPSAADLRNRWGQNQCAEFSMGDAFNMNKALLEIPVRQGTESYYMLHTGNDGRVDFMGGIWAGFGDSFPMMVGHRVRPKTMINVFEGTIKGILDILR